MTTERNNSNSRNKQKEHRVHSYLETQGKRIKYLDFNNLHEGQVYAAVIGVDGYNVFDMPDPEDPIRIEKGLHSMNIVTNVYKVLTHSERNKHTISYEKDIGHIQIDDVSFDFLGVYELNNNSLLKNTLERLNQGSSLDEILEDDETDLVTAELKIDD